MEETIPHECIPVPVLVLDSDRCDSGLETWVFLEVYFLHGVLDPAVTGGGLLVVVHRRVRGLQFIQCTR